MKRLNQWSPSVSCSGIDIWVLLLIFLFLISPQCLSSRISSHEVVDLSATLHWLRHCSLSEMVQTREEISPKIPHTHIQRWLWARCALRVKRYIFETRYNLDSKVVVENTSFSGVNEVIFTPSQDCGPLVLTGAPFIILAPGKLTLHCGCVPIATQTSPHNLALGSSTWRVPNRHIEGYSQGH